MSSAAPEITATRAPDGADAARAVRRAVEASEGSGQPGRWDIEPVISGPMAHRAGAETGRRWRWLAFAVVIAAAVMDLLDSTITQVAAPAIRRELGGSYAVIEWVTAAMARA